MIIYYLLIFHRCPNVTGYILEKLNSSSKLLNNEVYYSYIQTFTCSLKGSTNWLTKHKRVCQWNAFILTRYTKYSYETTFNTKARYRRNATRRWISGVREAFDWETNIQGRKIIVYVQTSWRTRHCMIACYFLLFTFMFTINLNLGEK